MNDDLESENGIYCHDCKHIFPKPENAGVGNPCDKCGSTNTGFCWMEDRLIAKATPEVIALLHNPLIFDEIDRDLSRLIVGENKTRKAITLFSFIRLVKNRGAGACSNLLVNAAPSVGKDYITRTICSIHPSSHVKSFSRVSPTALGRWMAGAKDWTWNGKICRISDISTDLVHSDAFKVFLSEDEASLLTGKDKSGQTVVSEVTVQGKPVLIDTTANAEASEELLARHSVIELDESQEQNKAVVLWKLEQAEGTGKKMEVSKLIRDAVDHLEEVEVVVPFASLLAKHIPTETPRVRRDIDRLLNLIRASAALHQFQRQRDDQGRVVAEGQDYAIAAEALTCIKSGVQANLTRAQRRVWDACLEFAGNKDVSDEHHSFTRMEIFAAKPICGQTQFYEHLSVLAKNKLLDMKSVAREGSTKPVFVYSIAGEAFNSLKLPDFKTLTLKTELSILSEYTELPKLSELSKRKSENSDNSAFGSVGDSHAV